MARTSKSKLTAAFVALATLGGCLSGILLWTTSSSVISAKSNSELNSAALLGPRNNVVARADAAAETASRADSNQAGELTATAATAVADGLPKKFNKCPPGTARKPSPSSLVIGQMSYHLGSGDTVYLYSAHYDDRQHSVRLIIDQLFEEHGPRHCQLWYSSHSDPYPAAATLYMALPVGGNHAVRRNYVYSCTSPVDQAPGEAPYAVGLVFGASDQCSQQQALAKVEYSVGSEGNMTEFGVCVSPFSKNYGDKVKLVEFIEINRMFGAQKFVFFNFSMSPNLEPLVHSYIADGLVDVVQFPLYPKAEQQLPYYAQVAAFHDCIYRYLNTVKYFAMLDLDEFIVPRLDAGAGSWNDLVHHAGGATSCLSIRNTFYKLEWPDDGPYADGGNQSLVARGLPRLCTLQKVWREKQIWRHGERSKYIVRTRDVQQLIVHSAFMASGKEWQVPETVALVQHYRDWGDKDSIEDVKHKGIYDGYLLQYGEAIVERVRGRLKKLRTIPLSAG